MDSIHNKMRVTLGFLVILFVPFWSNIYAVWEAGAKIGYDSNINRSVDHEQSDQYLAGFISYTKETDPVKKLEWTLTTTLEGTAYDHSNKLDSALLSLSPGLVLSPAPWWQVTVSPFLKSEIVRDEDQSSLAFGGSIHLEQQLNHGLYTGEYYIYTDSRAHMETYSFTEQALGVFLGKNWTPSFFSEIGYEYAHGTSFRTITPLATTSYGKGYHRRYSTTFGADVVRDTIDCHAIGLNIGFDWSDSLATLLGYTYTSAKGELGTTITHEAFVGMSYRF